IRNTRRRPTRAPSRPANRRSPPKAIRYALTTHARLDCEKCRSPWIDGSATLTIVASRTTISIPAHRTTSATHRPPRRTGPQFSAVLHALSEPIRLQIASALASADEGQSCASFHVPVTKSTCTHHFRVLREAGVIHQRQVGTARLNTLRREDLDARFPGLLETV